MAKGMGADADEWKMVRFNPQAVMHLAAVEKIIKSRGGLGKMPDVMQHIVIM